MAWNSRLAADGRFFLSFSFSFFFFLLVPLPSALAATLWSDVAALQGLRQAWNATPGLIQNWTWGSDPCWNQWLGVSCFQNSVTSLRLDQAGIVGTLPPSIGMLTNLVYLNLAGNPALNGPIPEEIGNLSRLYAMDLSNCGFSGNIPLGIGGLKNSSFIDLRSNNLSGEIPPSLGQMGRLTTLFLSNNGFYGCLPCAISSGGNFGLDNLTKIGHIDISKNSFSGPLPEFLLKLPLITTLNLSFNQFTGVLDGGVRQSGHVNVFLNDNNITSVANLPTPFIDPVLGGNPVCENQSFPLPDACKYSGAVHGPELWQQQTECRTVCDQNSVVHPTTCNCSYPLICDMYFGWLPTYGLVGARIGELRRAMATELNINPEQLWVEHAIFKNSSETQVLAKLLLYPSTPTQQWATSDVVFIQSQLGNRSIKLVGYDPYGLLSSTLRAPPLNAGASESAAADVKPNHHSLPIILGAIAGVLGFVAVSGFIMCYIKHRRTPNRRPLDNAAEIFDLNQQQFPSCLFAYEEVKAATRNFNRGNKIGEGTFGAVYKGTMRDTSEVAVKELPSNIKQGNQEFMDEVQLISGLQHKNLVKLRGCSLIGNSRMLVYEYVENKSLAQALFDPTKAILLEWPIRYNIALGMAKGLAYLHSKGRRRLAHGDIKASSVLLDRHLEPKIADFGLARLCETNERNVHTRIDGKRGYVAPEFALHGQLTPKTDVFSFGIVALELVSGRQSMNPKSPREEQYLLAWAWQLYEQKRVLELVDPKVKDGCDEEQAHLLIKVALLCSQGDPLSRPNMVRVVSLLSGDSDSPEVPVRPAFLGLGVTDPNKPLVRPSSLNTWN